MRKKIRDKERRSGRDRRNGGASSYNGLERRSLNFRRSGIERRKYKRLQIKDLAFAKLWSEHKKEYVQDMGQMLDISQGGLSVRCSEKTDKTGEHPGLGIFLSGDDFSIDKMPFKIISDTEITNGSKFIKRTVRRYGLQFEELTPHQRDNLDYFLIYHTVSED